MDFIKTSDIQPIQSVNQNTENEIPRSKKILLDGKFKQKEDGLKSNLKSNETHEWIHEERIEDLMEGKNLNNPVKIVNQIKDEKMAPIYKTSGQNSYKFKQVKIDINNVKEEDKKKENNQIIPKYSHIDTTQSEKKDDNKQQSSKLEISGG